MTPDPFEIYPSLLEPDFVERYDFGVCHTRTKPDEAISEFDVAVAVLRTRANLSRVASLLGRSRRSIEGFVLRHEFLPRLVEEVEATFLDEVETAYKNVALSGDSTAARFFLTTKGKDRGYVPRQEQTGKDGEPLVHHVAFAAEEAKRKLAAFFALQGKGGVAGESDSGATGGTSV